MIDEGPISEIVREANIQDSVRQIGHVAVGKTFLQAIGVNIENADQPKWADPLRGIKLAVFYHFLPHYRRGIFSEMEREGLDFVVYSDDLDISGIPKLDPSSVPIFKRTRIYPLGKLLIQPKQVFVAAFADYDVAIYFADPHFLGTWLAALVTRLRGKTVIFWGHGPIGNRSVLVTGLRRFFYALCDYFLAYGERGRLSWAKIGLDPARYQSIFNSLDYRRQIGLRNELINSPQYSQTDPKKFDIVVVGRLTARVKVGLLFDAVVQVCMNASTPEITITIVGDGPERSALELHARRLSLKVNFLGAIYEESIVSKILWRADALVAPGQVGLTAMHSLMYGTPVLTHGNFEDQMPEVEAVKHRWNGSLFEQNSSAGLAAELEYWLARPFSRRLLRENCFHVIDQKYNPANQVAQIRQVLERTCASKRRI
jgi:glycosyltransferase involved in cell wall biosynthesis